jgi:hypothetical protein
VCDMRSEKLSMSIRQGKDGLKVVVIHRVWRLPLPLGNQGFM